MEFKLPVATPVTSQLLCFIIESKASNTNRNHRSFVSVEQRDGDTLLSMVSTHLFMGWTIYPPC